MGQDVCRDPCHAQPPILGLKGSRVPVKGRVELLTLRHLQTFFSGKLSQRSLASARDALWSVFPTWAVELSPLRVVKADPW